MPKLSQKGAVHLLILIAAIGLLAFLGISSTFPFKDKLLNALFPKPPSHASGNIVPYFATAGKANNPAFENFFYYEWNTVHELARAGSTQTQPLDQPSPAPNHNHAWMVGKVRAYFDSGGYGNGNTQESINQIFEKEKPVIADILSRDINKGGVWIVGNEPTWPYIGIGMAGEGPDQSPDSYAYQFYKYHQFIKGLDPAAKLANAGFLLGGSTEAYINAVLNSPEIQGVKPDIYNFHFYGWGLNTATYADALAFVRGFRDFIHAIPGEGSKPIWLTEFDRYLFAGQDIEKEKEFMSYVIPRLIQENLIDKFFYFIGQGCDVPCSGWLGLTKQHEPNAGRITALGERYLQLAGLSSSPTPSPTPTPTPTPSPSPSSTPTPTPTPVSNSISGVVFVDNNKNGQIDTSEQKLSGRTVELKNNDDTELLQSTTTDGDGKYIFSNLAMGSDYRIKYIVPTGYQRTTDNSYPFEITPTNSSITHDFGIFRLIPSPTPTPTPTPTPSPKPSPTPPPISKPEPTTYSLPIQYSSTQGPLWYYYYKPYNSNPSNATYSSASMKPKEWFGQKDNLYFRAGFNQWLMVDQELITGGDREVAMIYWKAPAKGMATITVKEKRVENLFKGNGFEFGVGYGTQVGDWSYVVSKSKVQNFDPTEKTITVDRQMLGDGDALFFYQDSLRSTYGDTAKYSINIQFTPN